MTIVAFLSLTMLHGDTADFRPPVDADPQLRDPCPAVEHATTKDGPELCSDPEQDAITS